MTHRQESVVTSSLYVVLYSSVFPVARAAVLVDRFHFLSLRHFLCREMVIDQTALLSVAVVK